MGTSSNNKGRAYEYAWINVLFETLSGFRKTKIIKNSSFEANKKAWKLVTKEMQDLFRISAKSAVDTILELEPRMRESDGNDLFLEFQRNEAGKQGDVRDIVIKQGNAKWEVGLSIKHNHEAIKHSRLSYKLDFGEKWFGIPCSKNYWNAIEPIFNRLKKEREKGAIWSKLPNKNSDVYIPLLNAFIAEISRAYNSDPMMPRKMIEYLIGTKDYYKIISDDKNKMTLVYTFNIHKTLNRPNKIKTSAITVPVLELPTKLITVKLKASSANTVEMYLNNGWQISFRIHNASTYVEPSLKFDIQFIGMPLSILKIECKWR